MPQLAGRTKDEHALTEVLQKAETSDLSLAVTDPDGDGWSTVTLFGMPRTDRRFARFEEWLQGIEWEPVKLAGRDTSLAVVVQHGEMWRASFEAIPEIDFLGPSPVDALDQLLEDFEISPDRMVLGDDGTETRHVFHILPLNSITCPDCKGSGKYQGFSTVETCRRCGGATAIAISD